MPLERQLSQQRLTGNDIGEQKEARKNEEKHRIETKKKYIFNFYIDFGNRHADRDVL